MFSYAVSLGTPASLQDMLEVWLIGDSKLAIGVSVYV